MFLDRRRLISSLVSVAGAIPPRLGRQATPPSSPIAAAIDERYARPEWLADAGWLVEHLNDPEIRVVALTTADEFARGHVPGAVQIDWPDLEILDTADAPIARWRGEIERKLTELGIKLITTVVIYDGGTLFAARLWWVLHQLGHADARVLDGGLAAWREVGGAIETAESRTDPSLALPPYRGTPDAAVLAQLAEVEAAVGDPAVALVDARSAEEYAAGHIPGAVNVEFTANAEAEAPRYWKPAVELRALYEVAGVTADQRVIAYCTTGVRSAVTFFTLGLLGYDVELFTGSWAEWSAHPELPTTTGPNP